MKHLLNGVAIAAALVIAAPAWAQNPSGGNSVNTPGPNPGGPGLTPYSSGAPAAPPAAEPAPAAMPPSAMPPSASAPNSAMPPTHRYAHRHMVHHVYHHHFIHHGPTSTSDTTAQLNRAELTRIQSGGAGAAPEPQAAPQGAPGGEPMMQPQSSGRMPGPKPSGSGYIPPSQPPQPQ
ncbi:MAG TPA: hypothetical protein VGM07_20175 [Stellaceae bacterium]